MLGISDLKKKLRIVHVLIRSLSFRVDVISMFFITSLSLLRTEETKMPNSGPIQVREKPGETQPPSTG